MNLKSRITQKDITTLVNLIENHGYWSKQVEDFNSQFDYYTMQRLQSKARIAYSEKHNIYNNVF